MQNTQLSPLTQCRRWIVLATVGAALLLITLDHSVLYTTLPTLLRELGASTTQGLWIINAYPLVTAGLLLGAGTLGDRIGHRQMFLSGLLVFGLASLCAAFASTAPLLIAARAFLAVGAAAMMPATLALIRITFEDDRERNLAIAVWGSLAVVGSALGPILGGLLLERFWWGSVFLINVPVVVVAFAVGVAVTPHSATDASRPWDLTSSLQALVALSGLVYAIKEAVNAQPSWLMAAVAGGLAIVAGGCFSRRQRRLTYPLLDVAIFRNPAFLAGVLAAVFTLFAMSGVQLITTQRFQLVAGFSPLQAGLLVSASALACLPSALLGGALLHRVGLLPLIGGGLLVATVGVLVASQGLDLGLTWVVGGLVLLGLGLGAVMSVASSAIVGNAPANRAGMASSVEEVAYEFGSLFAVALLGSLLGALYSANVQLPAGTADAARVGIAEAMHLARADGVDGAALAKAASQAFDHSYRMVMYVIAGVLAIGTLVTSLLLRRHGPGSHAYTAATH
ncbi:Antiseptic resistance protein [Pseudomonas fluorescens]|uniref:MFS transporter n=1 Tax=Pseudomonas fluorescens TaxID=294 RepID=UPI00125B50AB|nr:MFS transporter [Pseudomonas fluorescens]CAG8870542.1 Antiseptic resistance protein [Pseudomonas fluorescens]